MSAPVRRQESHMQTKQEREQAFHDTAFAESIRAPVWGFYKITGSSRRAFRDKLVEAGLSGKRVLEYGSGASAQAFFLAAQGATVTGIDISPVAVEQGTRKAADEQLEERVDFRVMDAERLDFPDGVFDIVCGSGVLHHLDLSLAYAEIARVLRPGGSAIFVEPMGHNPLINAYRRRTPALRTVDEHPLLQRDLDQAREYFRDVETDFFHLSSLAAIPFRDRSRFPALLSSLERLDRGLFRLAPGLRKHAWMAVMRMADPIAPEARPA
jgi:SAM-dependent methyltransferase